MIPKIRNGRYLLSELIGGDRFYFYADRKKTVYTLNDEKPFEIKKQAGYFIKYANCRTDAIGTGGRRLVQFKADRYTIFMRNIHTPKPEDSNTIRMAGVLNKKKK